MLSEKRVRIFLAVVLIFSGIGITVNAEELIPTYYCKKAEKKIKIDGIIDKEWEKAEAVNFVEVESATVPQWGTEARMLWDKEYLYISFLCFDPDLWAVYKTKDSALWEEEVVEVFVDPDGDAKNYIELEINPYNTNIDLFWPMIPPKCGFTWRRAALYDLKGLKSKVYLKGTINNFEDKDEYWSVEIAIPWENFSIAKAKNLPPKDKDEWRINLYRYERPIETQRYELTAWSPTYKRNFHIPERFGKVIFLE